MADMFAPPMVWDHDLGRMANLKLVDKQGKSLSSWSYKY